MTRACGLRDYGTGQWEGGDPDCDHVQSGQGSEAQAAEMRERAERRGYTPTNAFANYGDRMTRGTLRATCGKCGATRIDNQLGLEPTPDQYVTAMVEVFREVRRVLRADGTLWLNLGDSYVAGQGGRQSSVGEMPAGTLQKANVPRDRDDVDTGAWGSRDVTAKTTPARGTTDLKPKDLVGIPWMVALALRADGWYLRSDIIWSKPNPMPESVTDRPTKAHEYLFLLTKSPRYFFDQEAVREPAEYGRSERVSGNLYAAVGSAAKSPERGTGTGKHTYEGGRNIRSVWEIATQPYPEAHFATFPEALPERCIKAGTSERGVCAECGTPWMRQVVTTYDTQGRTTNGPRSTERRHESPGRDVRMVKEVETTGWNPRCECGERHRLTVPATVLDPFMGSGTSALVARKLGRRSIGIELSREYAELAARRLSQLSLFAEAQ